MSLSAILCIISILMVVSLSILFRHEYKTRRRFLQGIRTKADRVVEVGYEYLEYLLRFVGRDFIRQILHYFFHRILRGILLLTRKCEDALRGAIRVNKTLARTVEDEREVLNKLEEVAKHKAENALTPAEKKHHKDRALRGM